MNYDHWKTTNPDDQWLGPEPDQEAMVKHSAFEKHREAKRELEMRRQVFKRRVDAGNMSASDAARKISIMQEIADEYAEMAEAERLV